MIGKDVLRNVVNTAAVDPEAFEDCDTCGGTGECQGCMGEGDDDCPECEGCGSCIECEGEGNVEI